MSRDLHDDVGQALTSVLLGLRPVESSLGDHEVDLAEARRASEDVRELVVDARWLTSDLRPMVLDDVGLFAALERLAQDMTARGEAAVELATDARLPPEVETLVYRVAQEALTNVVHHVGAPTASVTVLVADGRVRALVEDDGVGFDLATAPRRGYLGVDGMVERAELVGGTVQLFSTPGTVRRSGWRFPLPEVVRVALCDDHRLDRSGLRRILEAEADLEVVGEAGSVTETVALAAGSQPEVFVMDLGLADGSGITATAEGLGVSPATRCWS